MEAKPTQELKGCKELAAKEAAAKKAAEAKK